LKDRWHWSFSAGLITSTILNLLVLPTLALRFGRFDKDADDPLIMDISARPENHE